MSAPLEICAKRGVVAVLASGMVISLTALTGGIAPAFAKPGNDQMVTTTAPAPQPKAPVVEEAEPPARQAPQKAPEVVPAAPSVEAPAPQRTQQAVEPVAPVEPDAPVEPVEPVAPPVTQTTSAPVVTAVEPASPTRAAPPASKVESPAPRAVTPPSSEESQEPQEPQKQRESQEPSTAASTEASREVSPAPAVISPAPALVAPSSAMDDVPTSASVAPSTEGKSPEGKSTERKSGEPEAGAAVKSGEPTVSVTQAAKVIETAEPATLDAPKADVELARNAKPIEVKADPAPKQDVDEMAKSIGLDLGVKGPSGVEASANAKVDRRLASSRVFDRPIRQWRPDWVQYDEYYRPIIVNPYHERVRIVYVYQNVPRIVWIPPLARAVLEVAQFAAYSFTAVVDTAANIVNAAVNTALNVAVGTFFGGGYIPAVGLPLPPPPPPVLRYDNVPVFVNYSNARYEPFRVRRVIDVGDDPQFGERKVLLDGATPAWGVWTQTSTGERQFEVHRTQQFPGLDAPQEAPLPGDYQLRLASDESPSGMTGRDIFLYAAAGVTVALGFGAIGLALFLGRRRPQH
ncbi:hypothetical protein A5724_31360 [Mycobacterium sp. ACS1612]|uniref:hypothetical protein n=1 Tax=Mycobacterium sp. ACS1612 TaxID=1834117 RepID=UPI000801FFC5|nr:hypothetical protein [Mycobacterium sp. ACS1612]OBF26465.1 hypothetical protein A5724_31360 [Mycobacterium sp. ACS1612]